MTILQKPYVRMLKKTDGLTVWVVDGEYVRDELDSDFTEGGNDQAYPKFVPDGEIWIDDDTAEREWDFIMLHEITERNLMKDQGLGYEKAHEQANIVEQKARQKAGLPTSHAALSNANAVKSMLGLNTTVPSQGGFAVGANRMPWEKRINGKRICVYKRDSDSALHCYPNSEQGAQDADRYLAALYAHSKDAKGNLKTDDQGIAIDVIAALQQQYNHERANGALYDAFAAAFEFMNLSGFARFMAKNGDEERGHAKLFFDYLADLGEMPRVDDLPAPTLPNLSGDEFADTLALFEQALEAEKANKQALYLVNDVAEEEDDGTEAFLIPILIDQIKSIREFETHVTWLNLAIGNSAALMQYDEKLGK